MQISFAYIVPFIHVTGVIIQRSQRPIKFKKMEMGQLRPLFIYLSSFQQQFYRKIVDFSRIRTLIVKEEGKPDDHQTTTKLNLLPQKINRAFNLVRGSKTSWYRNVSSACKKPQMYSLVTSSDMFKQLGIFCRTDVRSVLATLPQNLQDLPIP